VNIIVPVRTERIRWTGV